MQLRHRTKKADKTRASLLNAALRVIARKGYSAATVDEIVKEAGVSKGLAYYHFKNKAALASAVLSDGIMSLVEQFERIAEASGNASDSLMSMFNTFTDSVIDNREFSRFFFNELWREGRVWSQEMRDCEERLVKIIAGEFERGQREGSVSPAVDPTFVAVSSIGLVLSTSLCYFSDRAFAEPISRDEFTSRVYNFVRQATQ